MFKLSVWESFFGGGGAPDCLFLLELSKENVCDGGDHRGLVLTFPQLPQELKVHVYQGVQLRKSQGNFNFGCDLCCDRVNLWEKPV